MLTFYFGCVGAGKTERLLEAYNSSGAKQGRGVLLLKPALDDRFGELEVASRCGLHATADALIFPDKPIDVDSRICEIYVDEAQFLSARNVDELRALPQEVYICCYGLATDSTGHLFEGSKRLFECADLLVQVHTRCRKCSVRNAIFNLKTRPGGHLIELDAGDLYQPVCPECWRKYVN